MKNNKQHNEGWQYFLKGRDPFQFLDYSVGDYIKVKYETLSGHWKVRSFTGLCISKRNHQGGSSRYSLKTYIKDIGIELSFDADNPHIVSMERVHTTENLKTSKLYNTGRKAKKVLKKLR